MIDVIIAANEAAEMLHQVHMGFGLLAVCSADIRACFVLGVSACISCRAASFEVSVATGAC